MGFDGLKFFRGVVALQIPLQRYDITNRIINPPEVMSLFILINTQRQRERTDNLYSFLASL